MQMCQSESKYYVCYLGIMVRYLKCLYKFANDINHDNLKTYDDV